MPTLQEFLTAAKPQNPGVDDVALTDYYNKTYGGQPTPAPQLVATSSPTLQEFLTAAKPQNPGVDDDALTDYYNKTYAKSAVPTPPPQEPNKEILGGIPRQIADVPLKVGAGVVTGVRMIADAFGADNATSKNLRGVENYVADLYSAQSKKDSQEVARIMKDAQDKGVLDNVVAGIKAFSVAPVDLLANALGTSAPAIVATLGTILTGGAPLVAGAVGVGTGAVMGAGVVKGSIYDATKQILGERTKMSPEQIEKTAIEAQNYEGKNLDQILLGALITGIGSVTGAETALARQLAKGIATTVAQKEAVKLATKEATETAAKRGVIKNAAYTAGKEFLGEGAEGGQERMAQNIAQQRLGFDVPTMRGVVGQGTLEGMAGLGMGAASGGREAAGAKRELAVQDLIKSGTSTDALKEAFTPPGRAKAAQQTRTDEELEKEFNAPPPSAANSLEELAAKYLTAYPEGKEGDISTDRKVELNVTKLNGLLKNLGIEIPKAEKGKTRINAMAALRDYMGKKNAGITEEELTDIPDLTGTPNGTQTTETVETETKGQQTSAATDVTPSITPEIQTEINRRVEAIGTLEDNGAPDNTIQKARDNLNKYKVSVGLPGTVLSAKAKEPIVEPGSVSFMGSPLRPYPMQGGKKLLEVSPGPYTEQKTPAVDKNEETTTTQDVFQYKDEARIADLQAQLADAQTNNGSQRSIDRLQKEIKTEQEKPTNVTLQTSQDQYQTLLDERTQREKDQAAAQARNEPRYGQQNIPANTEELYNDTREQLNSKVEEGNTKRDELVKQHDALSKQLATLEEKRAALDEQGDEANKSNDEARENQLLEQSTKVAEQEDAVRAQLQPVAQALNDYGDKQTLIPEWGRLDADEKDVYFNYIKKNTLEEHAAAAEALRAYRKEQGSRSRGYGNKKMSPTERRVALAYEENRASYSKIFPLKFPRWGDLSDEAKREYLRKVIKVTTDPITGKETLTYTGAGVLQDAGFADLGMHLLKEAGNMSAADKKKAEGNFKLIQQQIAVETKLYEERRTKNEADMQRFNQIMGRTPGVISGMTHSVLPSNVVRMVKDGDLKGVLQYLRTLGDVKTSNQEMTLGKKILKEVAQSIFSMNLKTTIRYVESLPGGDLAIYDPAKDAIFITADGLTNGVVLHEVVHAATVKVLDDYTMKRFNRLTKEQIRGVEHLISIMNATKGVLQEEHPRAYESIFEFVAYSLTDETLQADLHDLNLTGGLAIAQRLDDPTKQLVSILPGNKSAWSAFKLSIVKVLNAGKTLFTKNGDLIPGTKQSLLVEVSAAFDNILAVPTEPIYLDQLSAKQKAPLEAEPREGGFDDPKIRRAYELTERETGQSKDKGFFKQLFSTAGWRNIARLTTDRTYEARSWWARQDLGKKIIRDETKAFNHFTELMDTSTSVIQNYVTHNLSQNLEELKESVQDYASLVRGGDMNAAYIDIHMLGEMFGEPERRGVKFVTTVPLSTEDTGPKAVTFFGKQMGAASVRTAILGDPTKNTEGLIHKYALTDTQRQNLWNILKGLANTHADYNGYSPRGLTFSEANKKVGEGLKLNDRTYNVLGISTDEVNLRRKQYDAMPQETKDAIQRIFTSVKALTDATKELNQIGNFWSAPVSNLTGMYNYQYYMPFKGLSKFKEAEDPHIMDRNVDLDRMTEGKSKALLDQEYASSGRFSVSDNPILQLMFDSFRAAHRAGIVKATEALKNSAKYDKDKNPNGTGIIDAVVVENIPFSERETSKLQSYKGSNNTVFHYNEDGSIDVIRIQNVKLAEAIRYTYKRNNVALDAANTVTSWFGSMHTRYNWNFAPKNFVVDMLTNAWNIGGGKFGPANALVYIGDVGASVMRNGLGKAMQVAYLHDKGDPTSRKQLLDMASKDPFVRDMVEMLRFGGKSVYIDSMALRANYEKLSKVGRNKILANLDQFNAIVDTWNNMFEFTSRTAAYTLLKEKMYAANIEAGMSDVKNGEMSPAELAAAEQAAAETKNLANFEKVGAIGRELGAAFMFFRPSAMGAARAIETVAPAFMTEEMMKRQMPGNIQDDPAASALYLENYKKLRTNAQVMTSALMGMGYIMYLMSMMMAPDDEWKRNSVRSDDMQQWTKFARFHLPDEVSKQIFGKDSKNIVLQMPWGFGLGAFAAIGAQIGGMMHGQASWQKGFGNIGMSILSDSFLPIPISRIPPTDSPLKWAIDSVTPSTLRPIFEYLMNTNGIGQAINSANTRKYGEAFTGGDKIPDLYKDAARQVYSGTQGAWDMSPNTMYFFANSYLDGISRVGETAYSWTNLAKGEKIFNPKTDLPLIGSFFGSKSNVDSREFTSIETKLKDLDQRIKTLSDKDPVAYARFIANNPMADAAVGLYNSELVNINRIRAEANEIRTSPFSPKLKEQLLRINILQQNMAKHQFILTVKAYGVEP